MDDFPLQAFFASLAQDGVVLSVRDCDRLLLAFETGGTWTVPRLRNTLTSLLARDEDQQRLIGRRFERFFKEETGLERRMGEIDVGRVFRELESLPPRPEPPIPQPKPPPKQETASEIVKPEEPGEEEAYSGDGPPVRWWWIALLALVAVVGGFVVYIQNRPAPPPPEPAIQLGPICSLRPAKLHFGTLPLNEQRNIRFILANAGDKNLIIQHMALSPEQGPFDVALPAAPPALRPGEETRLVATFTPQTQGAFSAEIRIDHNAETGTDKVSLDGKGATFGRAVKRVPYVHDVQVETIPPPLHWNLRIALTVVLFCAVLLCILYTWRLHSGPFVKKPKVDEIGFWINLSTRQRKIVVSWSVL